MNLLFERRAGIFILSTLILFFSLYNINLSSFQLPNTTIRYIVFVFSLLLLYKSLSLPIQNNLLIPDFLSKIIQVLLSIFMLTILLTDNIYNIVLILLVFISFIYIVLLRTNTEIYTSEKLLISAYFLMFIVPFSSAIFLNSSINEVDNYSRFLLMIPIYLMLRDIKFNLHTLFHVINVTSILIGLFALYSHYINGEERVAGFTSTPITYGNISILFAILSFMTIKTYLQPNKLKWIPIIATIFALIGWVYTETRGPIISLFLFSLLLLNSNVRKNIFLPRSFYITFVVIIISIFTLTNIGSRVTSGYAATLNYVKNSDIKNFKWENPDSVTDRIILFHGSLNMIKKEPLTGVGLDKFNDELHNQIINKDIPIIRENIDNPTMGYNHAHNQYLDIFAKTGVLGFITLLYFIIINLSLLITGIKSDSKNINLFSLLGIITIITYSSHMLTQAIFSHQQSTIFMLIMLIIGLSSSRYYLNKDLKK